MKGKWEGRILSHHNALGNDLLIVTARDKESFLATITTYEEHEEVQKPTYSLPLTLGWHPP